MAIPVYLWLKDDGGNAVRGSVDVNINSMPYIQEDRGLQMTLLTSV